MNVEHAVSLARVIISETGDDNLDDIKSEKEEVHFIVTEDCLEKNHFYIEYALYKRKRKYFMCDASLLDGSGNLRQ